MKKTLNKNDTVKLEKTWYESIFEIPIEQTFELHMFFQLNAEADIFELVFTIFVQNLNCDRNCFQIINKHYLNHIKC